MRGAALAVYSQQWNVYATLATTFIAELTSNRILDCTSILRRVLPEKHPVRKILCILLA